MLNEDELIRRRIAYINWLAKMPRTVKRRIAAKTGFFKLNRVYLSKRKFNKLRKLGKLSPSHRKRG